MIDEYNLKLLSSHDIKFANTIILLHNYFLYVLKRTTLYLLYNCSLVVNLCNRNIYFSFRKVKETYYILRQ